MLKLIKTRLRTKKYKTEAFMMMSIEKDLLQNVKFKEILIESIKIIINKNNAVINIIK